MDDFVPENRPKRRLVESLQWTLHSEGICCVVSGLSPAHLAGRFKQVWFAGLYIAIYGTPEAKTVRWLLQYGANSKYFTLRELKLIVLSSDMPRGYGFENRDEKIG